MASLKEKILRRQGGKIQINLTIDKELKKELENFKDKNKIIQLSPMINEMLWEWLEQQEDHNHKKID